MARFTRLQVLNTMHAVGIVPVFYAADAAVAIAVAKACAIGGLNLFEFTNRGDFAWQVFAELERFCAKELPQMITGVGSIVDAATAALYINNGANFVVGPTLSADVGRTCNRRKVAYSPGCGSVSEISQAEELGCEIVKVFPGKEVGGPGFVRMVRGPMPWTSLMPTGGVEPTEESLRAWFDAGVACVGMGSNLIPADLVKKKDYDGIARAVAAAIALVKRIRAQEKP
jgi:2-dehydro-3-deoxyphosphogluconate aldolase / (4S)-4-hydroxy-2-oxoglutarate aldolase